MTPATIPGLERLDQPATDHIVYLTTDRGAHYTSHRITGAPNPTLAASAACAADTIARDEVDEFYVLEITTDHNGTEHAALALSGARVTCDPLPNGATPNGAGDHVPIIPDLVDTAITITLPEEATA